MTKRNIFLLFMLIVFSVAGLPAQTDTIARKPQLHDASIFLGAIYTPMIGHDLFGGNYSVILYPAQRYGLGISMSFAIETTTASFGYEVGTPLLSYFEYGINQQYDLVQKERIRLSCTLNNGIAVAELSDKDTLVEYMTRNGYRQRAKPVATNYFYQVQPGLDFSVCLFANENSPDVFLSAKARYNFTFGKTKFGRPADFRDPYFSLGLSLMNF